MPTENNSNKNTKTLSFLFFIFLFPLATAPCDAPYDYNYQLRKSKINVSVLEKSIKTFLDQEDTKAHFLESKESDKTQNFFQNLQRIYFDLLQLIGQHQQELPRMCSRESLDWALKQEDSLRKQLLALCVTVRDDYVFARLEQEIYEKEEEVYQWDEQLRKFTEASLKRECCLLQKETAKAEAQLQNIPCGTLLLAQDEATIIEIDQLILHVLDKETSIQQKDLLLGCAVRRYILQSFMQKLSQ
jgi:hypothetical protein